MARRTLLLWKKNIGNWGGFVAFGPDNTMYYSNGNQVTAISELSQGQSAFPNYTNNNPQVFRHIHTQLITI